MRRHVFWVSLTVSMLVAAIQEVLDPPWYAWVAATLVIVGAVVVEVISSRRRQLEHEGAT